MQEYHSSLGGIYTRACGTRANASQQTRDILQYSMINLHMYLHPFCHKIVCTDC